MPNNGFACPRDGVSKDCRYPNVGVVTFAPDSWTDRWMVRHHVMARLTRHFRVLWLVPPLHWREVLKPSKPAPTFETLPPELKLHTSPRWLPFFYRPAFLRFAVEKQRLARAVAELRQQGCSKFVSYVWHPSFAYTLDLFTSDLSCYHLEDEYTFSDVDLPIQNDELRLLRDSDQIFILSPALMDKKGHINPKTAFVPGGVDADFYSAPRPEPADLARIPHPRIGYTGHLKRQIDWELLWRLASTHSNWQFVFVGPLNPNHEIRRLVDDIQALPNTHFLGGKTSIELASYPPNFEVCIMPYRVDDYTKYIYPLKLHEYLATGRPTVGTPIRSLRDYKDVVDLPTTAEEWSRAVMRALHPESNRKEKCEQRRAVARQHDWNMVVERIANIIAARLAERPREQQLPQTGPMPPGG